MQGLIRPRIVAVVTAAAVTAVVLIFVASLSRPAPTPSEVRIAKPPVNSTPISAKTCRIPRADEPRPVACTA